MNIIYVVRHGQSTANENPHLYASEILNWEIPLTALGTQQAKNAGEFILNDISKESHHPSSRIPIKIYCSPYLRTQQTAKIIAEQFNVKQIHQNMLLSEWNAGEQDGVARISDFDDRPLEKHFKHRLGRLHYKPNRGESFLDVHTRLGLFVYQQDSFTNIPYTIIVGHMESSIALHYFLISQVMSKENEHWKNGEVRKYVKNFNTFEYKGIVNNNELPNH